MALWLAESAIGNNDGAVAGTTFGGFGREAVASAQVRRELQDALGHASPASTRRYDRDRHNLNRDATYTVGAALVGASASTSDS